MSVIASYSFADSWDQPASIMCYFCVKTTTDSNEILRHVVNTHPSENFSVRYGQLDEQNGGYIYTAKHFKMSCKTLSDKIDAGYQPVLDCERMTLKLLKTRECLQMDIMDTADDVTSREKSRALGNKEDGFGTTECPTEDDDLSKLWNILPDVINLLKSIGRSEDFISVLSSLADKTLSIQNISLHLLLDIGQFLKQNTIFNMRYHKTSLDFWVIVQKLFKGKGVRFFRGLKASGLQERPSDMGPVKPGECAINFIVPSDTILKRESSKFRIDSEHPGLLHSAIMSFAEGATNRDVKLAFDGKKIAIGFGSHLGEEDLSGHEQQPTLTERRQRLEDEKQVFEDALGIVSLESLKSAQEIDKNTHMYNVELKDRILAIVAILSQRIREQRQMVVKKRLAVSNLRKKVVGNWMQSPLARAISYIHTKIIKVNATIQTCLSCVDNLCYSVAVINGTDGQYVRGSGTDIYLQRQNNYVCLTEANGNILSQIDASQASDYIKQRTQIWYDIRKGAVLTGSTLYQALGFSSIKDMQSHYDEVHYGKEKPVSPELEKCFAHGCENEVHALGTLLGKIMPVFYPELTYTEDGCVVYPLGDKYMVVSGDGSGKTEVGDNVIAFEMKCPMENKQFATDVYYRLPVRYTLQILSQMSVKNCKSYANICFTRESTTLLEGAFEPDLWNKVNNALTEYATSSEKRPTKKPPWVKEMKPCMDDFASRSKFASEIPSLHAISCDCNASPATCVADIRRTHTAAKTAQHRMPLTPDTMGIYISQAKEALKEAYEHCRRPAKELLLTVMSDLDRKQSPDVPHAIPVMYNMGGFSLKMGSVRGMLNDAIDACSQNGLKVQVIAFDGQFAEISVDDNGRPLTMCRLKKKIWEDSKSLTKGQQLTWLFSLNDIGHVNNMMDLQGKVVVNILPAGAPDVYMSNGYTHLVTPRSLSNFVSRDTSEQRKGVSETNSEEPTSNDYIIQHLPQNIIDELDAESIAIINSANAAIEVIASNIDCANMDSNVSEALPTQGNDTKSCLPKSVVPDIDYEAALCAVLALDEKVTETIGARTYKTLEQNRNHNRARNERLYG